MNRAYSLSNTDLFLKKRAWELGGGVADLPVRINEPLPTVNDVPPDKAAYFWFMHYRARRHNSNLHSLRYVENICEGFLCAFLDVMPS